MPVGSSYEKRRRAFTVLTLASDSVSTSSARRSPSFSSTSTSFSDPCHSGAFAMSAAISQQRSIGASISTVFSPVTFPISRRTVPEVAVPPGKPRPPGHADGTAASGRGLPDQKELLSAAQPLDPHLFAHRGRAVGAGGAPDQLDRPPAPRVPARDTALMLGQPPLRVGRPAAVERAVGAAQQVDERVHARRRPDTR